ncbi:hypothetical protein J2X48_000689 [Bosea sp. BE271]|uniref:hypothetical protein n=1 Tax=Bosea TaxID=85413 RepID=UPI0028623434|nr:MULTISPECIES: hypothetical protein [Bosea]MDR6826507.1 hypothetical protein [Bosea robiniae]MDR6893217.1 hypothetical protein [Bosea sp. BE109]MDR7137084.1 hypothetical protein [Bosea sp. BE168]MDR7173783.1 hypothetical protein [Bosea sp. BE271]
MTDHSDLIRRLVIPMVRERSREPGDAWHQAEQALSSQSLSLSEAREEIERLRSELDRRSKDWAMMRGDNYAFNAVQKLNERATAAERLLTTFVAHYPMGINPFLDDAFRAARSALENSKARLADATNDPADSDLSSLRKGAEVAVKPLEWREVNPSCDLAETPFGSIRVYRDGTWYGQWSKEGDEQSADFEAAKSAAQSDFETRIRSALVSGSREDGASLLRTIETLPDDFTDDGNCCAGKLKEPRP